MTSPLPLLAQEPVTVYESPNPQGVYAYSPGIVRLASGRLVVTMDQGGPGVDALPEVLAPGDDHRWIGRIYTSDDLIVGAGSDHLGTNPSREGRRRSLARGNDFCTRLV